MALGAILGGQSLHLCYSNCLLHLWRMVGRIHKLAYSRIKEDLFLKRQISQAGEQVSGWVGEQTSEQMSGSSSWDWDSLPAAHLDALPPLTSQPLNSFLVFFYLQLSALAIHPSLNPTSEKLRSCPHIMSAALLHTSCCPPLREALTSQPAIGLPNFWKANKSRQSWNADIKEKFFNSLQYKSSRAAAPGGPERYAVEPWGILFDPKTVNS